MRDGMTHDFPPAPPTPAELKALFFTIEFDIMGSNCGGPPLNVTAAELAALVTAGEVEIRPRKIRSAVLITLADRDRRFLGRMTSDDLDARLREDDSLRRELPPRTED